MNGEPHGTGDGIGNGIGDGTGHGISNPPQFSFRRVGDSLVITRDGSMLLPLNRAKALLAFMQPEFGGLWVATKDLERLFYPCLLERTGSVSLSWQSVARALGQITRKRYKELNLTVTRFWSGGR